MKLEKIKLLLVEDNPRDIYLLVEMIREFGNGAFELAQATHFSLALKRIRSEKFSAILLDLSLPVFTGLEPLAQIRKMRPKLPVIVFSGHGDPQVASDALRMGARNFINKNNVDGAALVQTICSAVGK